MADDAGDGRVSWSSLLEEATTRLEVAGVEHPTVDARRIVEEAAGIEPSELHGTLDQWATVRGVARFDGMVARREAGEPLQYVLGRWGFRTLDLALDRRVLIPRPETEVVAGLVIDEIRDRPAPVVVDLGTGSGAIALAVATECPAATVIATDRSPEALAVARANLAGLGRAAVRVSLHEGSWFDAVPDEVAGRVDVVVANPPYVADDEALPGVVEEWEPVGALRAGPAGTEQLELIVAGLDRWLAPDGRVVLEMAPHQTELVAGRLGEAGFSAEIHPDLAGRDRAVVGRRTGRR